MVDDWGRAARSRSVSAVIFASLDEEYPEDCSIQGFSLKSLWESRRVIYSTEQPLVGVECGVPMEEHSDGADRDDNEVGCEESEGSAFNCSTRLRVSVVKVDITIKQRVIAKVCFRSKSWSFRLFHLRLTFGSPSSSSSSFHPLGSLSKMTSSFLSCLMFHFESRSRLPRSRLIPFLKLLL